MNKLTEKEAWLFIANQFDLLSIGEVNSINRAGLCSAAVFLWDNDFISAFDSSEMCAKITIYLERYCDGEGYIGPTVLWDGPKAGMKIAPKRAKVARKFAEECH